MHVAILKLADTVVRLEYLNAEVHNFFKAYLFDGKPEIEIFMLASDIEHEKFLSLQSTPDEVFPEWYYEVLAFHRKFCTAVADKNIILFHSSAISVDGEAYLFAAKSGTGKSTHARLWREMLGDRAVMINDDKPFLRLKDGKFYVYGSPWNGKHLLDSNICATLKGICFLQQSKDNRIEKLTPKEAFARLCKQVYFPEDREKYIGLINLVGQLAKMPVYLLDCNISREAAELSYLTMKEN